MTGTLREAHFTWIRPALSFALGEALRGPVGLGRVAPARAVEGRDVLERDQDVPVELHVGDVLDRAVRGEDAFLVFAAEEGCLLYTSPSPRDISGSRMPSSA